MESIDNIRTSLNEIDVLLDYASQNTETIFKYQLFNKVSIVLLSTKLEVFIEEFLEEHTLRALKGHTNKTISNQLKDRYLDRAVDLISKEKFERTFQKPISEVYGTVIEHFQAEHLLECKGDRIFLSRRGMDVSNYVLAEFLLGE